MRKFFTIFSIVSVTLLMTSCAIHEKHVFSSDEITISNPCADATIDFKLVSLIGDKDAQTMTLTGKFVNHGVNKDITVGRNLVAYDTEGDAHNTTSRVAVDYKSLTDVAVKFSFQIPGQVVPKKVKKMSVIAFDIDDCRVELRNVPIIWKSNKKEDKK